jgi:site-specific DNA-methyltransferase (adenine-specific)
VTHDQVLLAPVYSTALGNLYHADCEDLLAELPAESLDLVFADPPFNLGKDYGGTSDDDMDDVEYLDWCERWIEEVERVLKPGGTFFLYNLPLWNAALVSRLGYLTLRHWIAVEQTNSLPIKGKLYPAHYSLLYCIKGQKPKTFRRIRTPVETCRHCGRDIKDYGGHRSKLHPDGLTLKDVWTDIPTVRHAKFKDGRRGANTLSTKLLERCVLMATEPGDTVLDPFGGSGTTFAVCERWDRQWVGAEINEEFCGLIEDRLTGKVAVAFHGNLDVVEMEPSRVKLDL